MTFKEIKKILATKTVGIAGAGGLGSNCAVALARVGVGKLIIADFDVLSKDNLNRQYFFLDQLGQNKAFALADTIRFINETVEVVPNDVKLNPSNILTIFEGCDVIVEAFDLAEMKAMLIETIQEAWPDKAIVMGSGVAGYGNSNSIGMRKLGNLYICGDEQTEIADDMPPLAPRVGITANMQANVVLNLLLKTESHENNPE